MGSTSLTTRTLLTVSLLNAILSSIHLLPPLMNLFLWQRALLSGLRMMHGSLEFVAYVASTLSRMPRFTLWISLTLLVPIFILGFRRIWNSGLDQKRIVIFFLLFNLSLGITAVWIDALPVGGSVSCESSLNDGRLVRVIEYKEIGWHPGVVFFLAGFQEETSTWEQQKFTEIWDERKLESISDPCEDIRIIFPDL